MNDDAFARRFYADRAELESLGITLSCGEARREHQGYESELYSLPPENYYLPAIKFSDERAGGAANGPPPARRRVRLRGAPAAGAAAGLLGAAQPPDIDRGDLGRGADDGEGRRRRGLPAALEDRDRDLAAQDDRVHLLHDRARHGGEAQGRPLPPGLPRRPVLFDRPLPRARGGPGLPALTNPGQGLLRLEGRARLRPARGLRPPRLRPSRRVAARRHPGHRKGLPSRADRLAGRARLRLLRRDPERGPRRRRPRQGQGLRDRVRLQPPDGRLGPALAPERDGAGARRSWPAR